MQVKSRPQTVSLVSFKRGAQISKKEAQKVHFKARFYQGVGYVLSDDAYNKLKNSIQKNGKVIKIEPRGSVYLIDFGGISIKVVFNVFTDTLITVLS